MSAPRFYRIAKEWQVFRNRVLTEPVTPQRLADLRWAFYGGAISMFDFLRSASRAEVEDLGREMHEFAESVRQQAETER